MSEVAKQFAEVLLSVVCLTVLFYPLERLRPAEAKQRITNRLANYAYLPVALLWILFLQQVFSPWHSYLNELTTGGLLMPDLGQQHVLVRWLGGIAFAVSWDVWQYWIHRWQHTSRVLWETHKFHHSETSLNTSTQARHQLLSYVVYVAGYAPLLIIFGAVTLPTVISVLMFRVWGFVNHANVRIGFGRFTPFLAGPQWHRIHHSVLPEHMDKNFAAIFPFIDKLFGTYYEPAPGEYPATGLPSADNEPVIIQATVSPFRGWWRALNAR